jgi:hypothetical protein
LESFLTKVILVFFFHYKSGFPQLQVNDITLDIDSADITHASIIIGYIPLKFGRNSHHPHMSLVSQIRMVGNAWLCQVNTAGSVKQLNIALNA